MPADGAENRDLTFIFSPWLAKNAIYFYCNAKPGTFGTLTPDIDILNDRKNMEHRKSCKNNKDLKKFGYKTRTINVTLKFQKETAL